MPIKEQQNCKLQLFYLLIICEDLLQIFLTHFQITNDENNDVHYIISIKMIGKLLLNK